MTQFFYGITEMSWKQPWTLKKTMVGDKIHRDSGYGILTGCFTICWSVNDKCAEVSFLFLMSLIFILQTFHGVWTIAFFCLTVIETGAILPNASCLLAGYLPATTVLHILLIPNNYPLEYIITDAVGTFLAIITMFLLLRMECTGKKKKKYKHTLNIV